MATVTITGASDDLLELDGDIYEEFYPETGSDSKNYLAFSDGTVLSVVYDQDGIWRLTLKAKGTAELAKVEGCADEDTNDVVTLTGDIKWAVFGRNFEKATQCK